jgi:hypothetical protein
MKLLIGDQAKVFGCMVNKLAKAEQQIIVSFDDPQKTLVKGLFTTTTSEGSVFEVFACYACGDFFSEVFSNSNDALRWLLTD